MNLLLDIIVNVKAELLCIIILVIILIKTCVDSDKRYIDRVFQHILLCCIIFTVSFALRSLIDHGLIHVSPRVFFWINAFYLIFLNIIVFLWFFYSETIQQSQLVATKLRCVACSLPAIIFAVITLASSSTKWIFYIDADSIYHRGNLFLLQYLVPLLYTLITSCKALYLFSKKENYERRNELKALAIFPIPIILAALSQLVFPEILSLCIGFPLGTLLVYMSIQDSKISMDALTQLNNRGQMARYLAAKIKNRDRRKPLYLIMMDVDHFKAINDKYGHVEGDLALVRVADALKQFAKEQSCFLSRYGGDEFIVILEGSADQVDSSCKAIEQNLSQLNAEAEAPYPMTVTIGYAEYTDDISDIPSFIHAADKHLYQNKRARNKSSRW